MLIVCLFQGFILILHRQNGSENGILNLTQTKFFYKMEKKFANYPHIPLNYLRDYFGVGGMYNPIQLPTVTITAPLTSRAREAINKRRNLHLGVNNTLANVAPRDAIRTERDNFSDKEWNEVCKYRAANTSKKKRTGRVSAWTNFLNYHTAPVSVDPFGGYHAYNNADFYRDQTGSEMPTTLTPNVRDQLKVTAAGAVSLGKLPTLAALATLAAGCSSPKRPTAKDSDKHNKSIRHYYVIDNPTKEEIEYYQNDIDKGKAYYQKRDKTKNVESKIIGRIPNKSISRIKSQKLENEMYTDLDADRNRVNYRTRPFDIPYGDREIIIKPRGDSYERSLSVNALDSLAKYAGITGIPIQDALGLAWRETKMGRMPLFNDGKLSKEYTDTDLENSYYFKSFGTIPAEYLVRDFRYNGDILYKGKRYHPISLKTPPLQHAFEFFKSGKYNPGDKHHTADVKSSGDNVWNETTGTLREWWIKEGKKWYHSSKK